MKTIKKFIKNNMPGVVLFREKIKNYYYSKVEEKDYPKKIKKWYKKRTGEILDLDNPKNYTQKIQWLKINDSTQIKADLSDKYKVREWVADKIGEKYLVPMISGGYTDANQINFEKLPNKFVLKASHGSGWNIIVKDKSRLNIRKTVKRLNKWLKLDYSFRGDFELHYGLIKPCILIEEYIENFDGELNDYKFLCFNGKPYYCWVDTGRYTDHRRNVYDMDWKLQPWQQYTYKNSDSKIQKPDNFEKMVELAQKLAEGFKHVRVDFYNINGKIMFGEMTFTNGSGIELIYPDEMNVKIGQLIDIDRIK